MTGLSWSGSGRPPGPAGQLQTEMLVSAIVPSEQLELDVLRKRIIATNDVPTVDFLAGGLERPARWHGFPGSARTAVACGDGPLVASGCF